MASKVVDIRNKVGLHARPAALFVQEAQKYASEIKVEHNGQAVNAKSLLGILGLGVASGERITLLADGPDENEALAALARLVENNFGEE